VIDAEQSDYTYMKRCFKLAELARTEGDAAVGCVIVRANEILAEACERVVAHQDPTAHAELLAIRRACESLDSIDLSGCTLYTNIEPCWMCSFVIRETRVSAVVVAQPIDGVGGVTSRYPILTDGGIDGWDGPPNITWLTPESVA